MTINFELYTRASSGTGLGTSLDPEPSSKASLVTNLAEKINTHFGAQLGKNYVINNQEGSFYVRFKNSETREITYIHLDGESEEAALCRQIFNVAVVKKAEPAPPTTSQDDLKIAALRTAIREHEEFFSRFGSQVSDLLDTSLANQSESLKTSLEKIPKEKKSLEKEKISLEATLERLAQKLILLQDPEKYWQKEINQIKQNLDPKKEALTELQKNEKANEVKIFALKKEIESLKRILAFLTKKKEDRVDPKKHLLDRAATSFVFHRDTEKGIQKEFQEVSARLALLVKKEEDLTKKEATSLEKKATVEKSIKERAAQGDFRLQSILNEPITDKKEYIAKLEAQLLEFDQIFEKVKERLKNTCSLFLQFKRNAVERLEERKQGNLGRIAELEKEIAAKPVGSGEIPRLQRRIAFYQEMIAKIDVEILESRVELEAAEQKEAAKKNEEEKAIKAEKEKAAQRAIEKAAKEAAEAAKKEAAQRAAAEKRAARSATSAMNSPRLTSLDYIFQLASSSPSSSA